MKLEDEFKQPYEAWKTNPGPQTTGDMLISLEPVMQSALRSYGGPKPSPTLHTRAKVLAADALVSYDPSRGKLRTHMLQNLQRLQRYTAREQSSVRVPEAASGQRRALRDAEEEFKQSTGRPPSYTELANATGLSVKRVAAIRNAPSVVAEGTLKPKDKEQHWYTPAVAPRETQLPPWIDLAYDDLPPTDQFILESTLGLHGAPQKSSTQLAKELGISSAAVSKRLARIQETIDGWEDLQ